MTAPIGGIAGYLTITGATQADQDILRVQESLNLAAGSMTRMGAATDETSGALAGASRASASAAAGSNKQRINQLSLIAAEEKYNAALADTNASNARLASTEAAVLRAQDRVTASTNSAAAAQEKYGASAATTTAESEGMFAKLGGGVETLAKLGLAFGAFEIAVKAVDEIKAGVNFQKQMLLIQTNAGASEASVKQFNTAILGMAGGVATGPEDLATAMYHVASAGEGLLTTAQQLNVLKIAAEGAKVGNADLEETTNALTGAVTSGIKGTGDYSQAMGSLIAIVGAGDMKLSDLNDALSTGGLAVLKGYGLSLDDVGAALATFGDNQIRGAQAMTTLRTAVQFMTVGLASGKKALASLGLTNDQLTQDMQKGGLNQAVVDLSTHLKAAGYNASDAGEILTQAFGKKAGPGIAILVDQLDRFQEKEKAATDGGAQFGLAWKATQGTVSFALSQLAAEAQAAGIALFEKLEPGVEKVTSALAKDIPAAVKTVQSILQPLEQEVGGAFTMAWHGASEVIGVTASALSTVGKFLEDNKTLVTDVVTPVLAMWAAYKGYTIAVAAMDAIWVAGSNVAEFFSSNVASVRTWGAGVSATLNSEASEAELTSSIMQAELLAIGKAAQTEAAQVDAAAAQQLEAYATLVRGSEDASASQIAAAENAALAAQTQAEASTLAADEVAAAATTAATTVDVEGEAAAIGWGAMLGPVGLVTAGIAALTFGLLGHKKAQTDDNAAVADFTQLLQASNGVIDQSVIAGIAKKASDDGLFKNADKLGISTKLVTDALAGQGTAAADLNKKLAATAGSVQISTDSFKAGGPAIEIYTATGKRATQAQIDQSNTAKTLQGQMKSLGGSLTTSVQQQKDIATAVGTTTKTLADGSTQATVTKDQFADLAAGLYLSTTAAQNYAGMLGFAADSSGDFTATSAQLATAIGTISNAENTATATGSNFLAAVSTFSQSAGTAADRAKLIGATLVNANGDMLSFDGTMVQTATAAKQFGTDLSSAATDAKESNKAYLASIMDLKTGTLNYSNAAAAPLISDLQGIQTAAENAAEATYQHELATKGATIASDDAVKVYQGQTSGALAAEAKALGLNKTQTDALAKSYFSLPADIKTTVESEGSDQVSQILDQIGQQLSFLTGHKWVTDLSASVAGGQAEIKTFQGDIDAVKQGKIPGLNANTGPGKTVVDTFQQQINAIKQGKPPTLAANKTPGQLAVDQLTTEINNIRQGKVPGLDANSHQGQIVIGNLQGDIDSLTQHHVPSLDVATADAISKVETFYNLLENPPNVPIEEINPPKSAIHRASGGSVFGPGTTTSDSIPAMLSTREEVMNARAADEYRPLLDAMNAGQPIPASAMAAMSVGSSSVAAPARLASVNNAGTGPLRLHPADIAAVANALAIAIQPIADRPIELGGKKVNRQLGFVQSRRERR